MQSFKFQNFNPFALSMTKTPQSFGSSKCKRLSDRYHRHFVISYIPEGFTITKLSTDKVPVMSLITISVLLKLYDNDCNSIAPNKQGWAYFSIFLYKTIYCDHSLRKINLILKKTTTLS